MPVPFLRDPSAPLSTPALACALLTGLLLQTPATASASSAADDLPLPARVLSVYSNGSSFEAVVHTDGSLPANQPLTLTLRDRDGGAISSLGFPPPPEAGESSWSLPGDFANLPTLGLQYSVELAAAGSVLHELDVRLSLDCSAAGLPCLFTARSGVRIDGALHLGSLGPSASALLDPLADWTQALADPHLRGLVYEAAIDLGVMASEDDRCLCFYTAALSPAGGAVRAAALAEWSNPGFSFEFFGDHQTHASDRFTMRHGSPREAQVDFLCASLERFTETPVLTTAGLMILQIPELKACSSPCDGPVEWRLRDFYESAIYKTQGWAGADLDYQMVWKVDEIPEHSEAGSWGGAGTMMSPPAVFTGLEASPTPPRARLAPTSGSLEGSALVTLRDWSRYQLPYAEVAAGATLEAVGTSECAPEAVIRAAPRLFRTLYEPQVLDIEVVSEVEEDP